MNMGNLNKLALTAQEALQQTIVIASENESSQAEPIHMLKALLESKENNRSSCRPTWMPRSSACRRSAGTPA